MMADAIKAPSDYLRMRNSLRSGNLWYPDRTATWINTNALVGSGGRTFTPGYISVNTGTTASSSAAADCYSAGLDLSGTARNRLDWRKKLLFQFSLTRSTAETETSAYVQLKESTGLGDLAQKGLGVKISNLTLVGECYGTSRDTVGSQLLVSSTDYHIAIVHDPDNQSISWYINNVLLGQETTAAKIPNAAPSADCSLVISIANGVTGTINAVLEIGNILVFQSL